ncbi:MAG: HesB/IscA family protein [Anaerolineales bacterium]|jgi:iron-sulfur cluster assembly accessory protein
MQPVVDTNLVNVSSTAVQAIQELLNEKNLVDHALRLFVAGKSCSGYQFGLSLDNNIAESDTSVEVSGIKIVVDNQSLEFVKGTNLDFIDDERGKGFLIENPNMATSCDCGGDSGGGCGGGCC